MSPRRPREASRLDADGVAALMQGQDGVISRRQVLDLGGSGRDIARRLNRRDWSRLHPGVHLDHTGEPTWDQQAWAAVLARWPAALGGASAVRAHGLRGARADEAAPIRIVIPATRSVDPLPGARVERIADFDTVALLHLHPPRACVAEARGLAGRRTGQWLCWPTPVSSAAPRPPGWRQP